MKRTIAIIISIMLILAITLPTAAFSTIAVKSIKLNKSEVTLNVGETSNLKVTFTPANTTQKNLTYTTSNKNVISVSSTGVIKGLHAGNATITVYTVNKKAFAKCKVTVSQISVSFFMSNQSADVADTYNDTVFVKEAERLTGIHIKWIHPVGDTSNDQLNLLFASKQTPDMYCINWSGYNGGVLKAEQDGIVIPLNDLMNKNCPSVTAYYNKFPMFKTEMTEENGKIYSFPMNAPESGQGANYIGPMVNKTWLDKLGIKPPETLDQWEKMLLAFKTKDPNGNGKQDEIPIISLSNWIPAILPMVYFAYNTDVTYYHIGNKVYFGPLDPQFKTAVQILARWYDEGLIDKDFVTDDYTSMAAKLEGGQVGAADYYMDFSQTTGCKWIPVKYPTLKAGDTVKNNSASNAVQASGYCISKSNKHPIESAKYLDFWFSDQGKMLQNYGVEGISYKMVNGQPRFTDAVLKNPDGLTKDLALELYTARNHGFPGIMMEAPDLETPEITQAFKLWGTPNNESMPPLKFTADEAAINSKIRPEVETYMDEMLIKYITGKEPFSTFEKMQQTMRDMGIEKPWQIRQDAYNRFLAKVRN